MENSLRITINFKTKEEFDTQYDQIVSKLLDIGITDFHVITSTFEEYLTAVKQRNSETHADGHEIAFNIDEKQIDDNLIHFIDCWENGLSPYKALTFFVWEIK